MYQVSLEEAKVQFLRLIQEALQGREVVITQNNVPMLKLVPISKSKPRAQFGSAKGLVTMSEDFDAPLEDFKVYMQ
ncbi:MAG: type II toxin-antitoxin system prevent-host-death family antitoxin [candidate division KSB1 bacterium]|nr:type II toxin-antitoxin system prevent-host-death family antitoxin [candidate division KSB1 bacterium]MDZ7300617.1 type II toxin-antitoxin system prevent-host-death family antitoxin [candidate division KSB1 bacterium]MDZ7309754.1 type II toxin-antitoxin system prevent-host-death family antitoxin [candidate division KSB1 bacterium]